LEGLQMFIEMKDTRKQDLKKVKKQDEITRREAMAKIGLTAFSAATMMLLLNKPENAQAQQGSIDDPEDPGDPIDW